MNLKAALFSLIYGACRRLGYEARFHPLPFNDPSLDSALRRLSTHQIAFNSLIGVGASNGSWSKAFAVRFPGKHHLLVDANRIHLPALEAVDSKCLTGSIDSLPLAKKRERFTSMTRIPWADIFWLSLITKITNPARSIPSMIWFKRRASRRHSSTRPRAFANASGRGIGDVPGLR